MSVSEYKEGDLLQLYFESGKHEIIKGHVSIEHCQEQLDEHFGDRKALFIEHRYGHWVNGKDDLGNKKQYLYERTEYGLFRMKITCVIYGPKEINEEVINLLADAMRGCCRKVDEIKK